MFINLYIRWAAIKHKRNQLKRDSGRGHSSSSVSNINICAVIIIIIIIIMIVIIIIIIITVIIMIVVIITTLPPREDTTPLQGALGQRLFLMGNKNEICFGWVTKKNNDLEQTMMMILLLMTMQW